MNNTFDFTRFSLLVKRQWVENKKLFLMASFAILGIGAFMYSFNINWVSGKISEQIQEMLFWMGFFVFGTLFTNFLLKDLNDKNSATSFLQIPASHLEKIIVGIIYSLIFFPIVYIILYNVLDLTFVKICQAIHTNFVESMIVLVGRENIHKSINTPLFDYFFTEHPLAPVGKVLPAPPMSEWDIYFSIWTFTQSFAILGSTYFSRWSLIKTAFAGFIIFFGIYLIIISADEILLEGLKEELRKKEVNDIEIMFGEKQPFQVVKILFQFIFPPLLFIIAYFKLKEKQI